jgi:hypothetical protein
MKILIPKFAEYQHYGKRMPPWIKLHKKLLDDHKFWSLKAEQQILLIALWLLASENALEEGHGVVEMTRKELTWRLRDVSLKNLDALKDSGFIQIEDASNGETPRASRALARRLPQREGERETETEGEVETEVAALTRSEGGPKKSWAREAAEDWDEHFGKGSSAPGRIGAALTRLVKAHGWTEVRPIWQRYIAEKDPTYASPQDFASKYQVWADGSVHVGGEGIEAHNRQQTQRFLDGEKGLPSQRGLSRILPPGKDT